MMLQGRKLAHLYGRRFDSLNRHEWFTFLFAHEDNVEGGGGPRIFRWLCVLSWLRHRRQMTSQG